MDDELEPEPHANDANDNSEPYGLAGDAGDAGDESGIISLLDDDDDAWI